MRRREHFFEPHLDWLQAVFVTLMCLLAASLPNEAVLGGYSYETGEGFRSPAFYVGSLTAALSVLILPKILINSFRSVPFFFITLGFGISYLVLIWAVMSGDAEPKMLVISIFQVKPIYMCALFLFIGTNTQWRSLMMQSYLVGWLILVLASLYLVASGKYHTGSQFGIQRVSVMGMNENVQSTMAASGVVLAYIQSLRSDTWKGMIFWNVAVLLGLGVFLVGVSRTALFSLVVGVLLVNTGLIMNRSSTRAMKARYIGTTLVLVLLAGIAAARSQFLSASVDSLRTRTSAVFESRDFSHRDVLARDTLQVVETHPWGVGLGRVTPMIHGDPHNSYLKLLAEGGMLALASFVVGMFILIAQLARKRTWSRGELGSAAAFFVFSTAAFGGQSMAENPYWFFLAQVIRSVPTTRPSAGDG